MARTARVFILSRRGGSPPDFRSRPGPGGKIVMRPVPLIVLLLFGVGLVCWKVFSGPLSESATTSATEPVSRTFVVFDATLYKQKPDMRQYGVGSITILYEGRFWPTGQASTTLPDAGTVRALVGEVASSISPVVIDIERWPVTGSL